MLRLTSLTTTALLWLPTSGTNGTILPRTGVSLAGMRTADRASVLVTGYAAGVTGWASSADRRADDVCDSRIGRVAGTAGNEASFGTSILPRTPNHSNDERFAPYQLSQSHAPVSRPPDKGRPH